MQMDDEVFRLINFLLNFGIIPLIAIIWKLNNNIADLKTLLYQEFVTNARFQLEMEKKANKRR